MRNWLLGGLIIAIVVLSGCVQQLGQECTPGIDQCKEQPDETVCSYGSWCDETGRICGGQSCVGLSLGKCLNEKCENTLSKQ